jgi:rubrerythrin
MRLDSYPVADLYLSAIKAEIEAARVYYRLARTVRDAYLERRLLFLATEEESHRRDLSRLYMKETGKRFARLPARTLVPMPRLLPPGPGTSLADVIASALAAERGARSFYQAFSRLYPDGSDQSALLRYFSGMEKGHGQLLQAELASLGPDGIRPGGLRGPGVEEAGGPLPELPDEFATDGMMVRTGALEPRRAPVGSVARKPGPVAPAGRWAMERPGEPVVRKRRP